MKLVDNSSLFQANYILKITDGASSIYHFGGRLQIPHTDPSRSAFNASISSFRQIHYLQLMYLSM